MAGRSWTIAADTGCPPSDPARVSGPPPCGRRRGGGKPPDPCGPARIRQNAFAVAYGALCLGPTAHPHRLDRSGTALGLRVLYRGGIRRPRFVSQLLAHTFLETPGAVSYTHLTLPTNREV